MNEKPEINIDKKNEIPENCKKCGRKLVKKMKDEDNLLTCPNCGNTIDMGIDQLIHWKGAVCSILICLSIALFIGSFITSFDKRIIQAKQSMGGRHRAFEVDGYLTS